MATPKQNKFIKLLLENLGKPSNTKTLGEMILEAGYSETMAKNPYQILESETIQEGIEDFIKILDDKRRMAVTKITEDKLDKASARDNAYISEVLTKQHQLLNGGVTDNQVMTIQISEAIAKKNDLNQSTESNS